MEATRKTALLQLHDVTQGQSLNVGVGCAFRTLRFATRNLTALIGKMSLESGVERTSAEERHTQEALLAETMEDARSCAWTPPEVITVIAFLVTI